MNICQVNFNKSTSSLGAEAEGLKTSLKHVRSSHYLTPQFLVLSLLSDLKCDNASIDTPATKLFEKISVSFCVPEQSPLSLGIS
ncbi:unnamed protein product [Cylicocyclus nassatus]|uniref:Uncharacterized protein n=1 Tax=Cylicocyclus nassatus TaxID=53992 RepID=A0AA36GVI1_CYLNA|nr:unnamed protein product [Cylicocyclus nassatus]